LTNDTSAHQQAKQNIRFVTANIQVAHKIQYSVSEISGERVMRKSVHPVFFSINLIGLTLIALLMLDSGGEHIQAVQVSTATPIPIEDLAKQFDYDDQAPLKLEEAEVREENGIQIRDISFASPVRGRVSAYLVVPVGKGPFAGLIYMSGSGGSRDDFLDDAKWMAQLGVVSLLPEFPLERSPLPRLFSYTAGDRDYMVQAVIELRRTIDVLLAQPNVDADRIGFVGFSLGSMAGSILAGVDKRIAAYAFMSGGVLVEALRSQPEFQKSPGKGTEYIEAMESVNQLYYIGHAAPAAVLFQNGTQDTTVTPEWAKALHQAASEPKTIKWYEAGHFIQDEIAPRLDRAEWFHEHLGIRALTAAERATPSPMPTEGFMFPPSPTP
jgi:dienelactone hydrolase